MFDIVKGGSSTLLAELTFRHTFYLVRDVHVADIRVAWLVYLVCLRSHVLRAYFNLESKQAISVTPFGRRPNNNDSVNSKRAHAPLPGICHLFGSGGGEFVRKPLPEAGEFVNSSRSS